MRDPGHDRRRFLLSALAGTTGLPSASALATLPEPRVRSGPPTGLAGLNLAADVEADLEAFAQPVLKDVAYLSELPLDDLDPAFVFLPRR